MKDITRIIECGPINLHLHEEDASPNERAWIVTVDGGQMRIVAFNDAQSCGSEMITIDRQGEQITRVRYDGKVIYEAARRPPARVNAVERRALEYVRNTGETATVKQFEEDHEPIGRMLLIQLVPMYLMVDAAGVVRLTAAGKAALT